MGKLFKPMSNQLTLRSILFCFGLLMFSCGETTEEEPSQLQIGSDSLVSDAESGTEILEITGNVGWNIVLNSDWVSVNPTQGQGNASVTFSFNSNNQTASRTVQARIVGGGIVRTLQITQAAAIPEFPSFYIPADQTGMRDISSLQLAGEMGVGWNVGNSLEAIGGETAWGNPVITKRLIDQIKAAGFNSVRIPVAWSKFTNAAEFTIDPTWLNRAQEVVDYVIDNDMYAILNNHWDKGWMQPTFAQQNYVNDRLEKMWIQIALHFRDYEDHLLFAGTNEVMVTGNYGTPTTENHTVQNGFNQIFVDAVRSTGGRNTYRNLVVQTYNTNIDHGINFFKMPTDPTSDRLMVEVHYYDPYEFALKEEGGATQWGNNAANPASTAGWGNEAHTDSQFQKMKINYVDKGIPVLVGEYGAISRLNAPEHETYREAYFRYVTKSIRNRGMVPFYWDNGFAGNHGFALFDRATGNQLYPDLIKAIVE